MKIPELFARGTSDDGKYVDYLIDSEGQQKGIFGAIANVARTISRFDESKHRRGQPANRGQFASGGGSRGQSRTRQPRFRPSATASKPKPHAEGSIQPTRAPTSAPAAPTGKRPPIPGSGKPPANLGKPKTAQEAVDHMVWLMGRAGTLRQQARDGHPLSDIQKRELTASIHMANRLRAGHFTLAAEAGGPKPTEGAAPKAEKKPAGPPKSLHEQIASHPGAVKFGLTLQVLSKMHPDAVASVAQSLGIKTEKSAFRLPSFVVKGVWDESKHPRNNLGHFAGQLREHISGLTGHPDEHTHAEHWAGHLQKLTQSEVYHVISKAGVEGARPHDTKSSLIQRARARMTALARSKERAQA